MVGTLSGRGIGGTNTGTVGRMTDGLGVCLSRVEIIEQLIILKINL